jgi:XTP/dITP diphosphohydrolase
MTLYAATSNRGKLREFTEAASAEGITVLPLPGLDTMPVPVEDAPDFMGNAALKAIAYSRLAPGLLVFADDSGLEVDALGGDPGVRSARYADQMNFEPNSGLTPGLSKDERNNRCLLSMLQQVNIATQDRAGRHAQFVCELALARDGQVLRRAEGIVEGEMLDTPRGQNGFGYDPLFFIPQLGKTMAELGPEAKWAISHRGRAFRSLLQDLHSLDPKIAHSDR